MLWERPIYKFRLPLDDAENPPSYKEIVIDVTGSAPSFTEPSEALKEVVLDVFAAHKISTVLEFGAGKLKNVPFLLKQGKKVCAVEFRELEENEHTKGNLKKCEKFGAKFQKLVFPNEFLTDPKTFDLALLLNVVPVMPIPAERLYLLDLLYHKVNDGKYLLWVAQKEGSYKKIREEGKQDCGDGLWMGLNRAFKTFYRYHQAEEVDELMALYGFQLIKRFSVGDDARLYQKCEHNLFLGLISPETISKEITFDDSIADPPSAEPKIVDGSTSNLVIPNPRSLSVENLYKLKIRSILPGTETAEAYHRTVSLAIGRIFRKTLRNMDIKVNILGGVKIVDTVFTNSAENGFFRNLREKVECSYPMFEMKDISKPPTNDELDQLNGRLNDNRGHFGVLVCRVGAHDQLVLDRCRTYLPNNYVLVLDDSDVFELLDYTLERKQSEIDDFMDRKLRDLLF